MSPKNKLDKRLYAAKVNGIILFAVSIIGFIANVSAGIMSIFLFPHDRELFENAFFPSDFLIWVFSNYTVLAFSFSLIWIPLFFASRALFKFKEWGRMVCVIILFFLMTIILVMGVGTIPVKEMPVIIAIMMMLTMILYAAVLGLGVYFLMRRSTREGIRDYNLGSLATAEMAGTATVSVKTAPAPLPPIEADPRYELAKRVVADVRNVPLPAKKKKAALIVAGIMMIAFPAIWAFFSFLLMLSSHDWKVLYFALSVFAGICSVWIGIMIIGQLKRYRLIAVLITLANLILMIVIVQGINFQFILFFGGYYVAILALLVINYNKFIDEEINDEAPLTEKIMSPADLEMQELQRLMETKTLGEINEEEFEQKTFEIKVKFRTQDMAGSLLKRKNNGMLSEEEYQKKMEQLLLEKQEEVKNEMRLEKDKKQIHALRLSQILPERIEKLTIPNQKKLEKYIDLMEPNDIIVFHDHQIKLIRAERWEAINEANTQDEFEIIIKG